jgi:hypothetical protein
MGWCGETLAIPLHSNPSPCPALVTWENAEKGVRKHSVLTYGRKTVNQVTFLLVLQHPATPYNGVHSVETNTGVATPSHCVANSGVSRLGSRGLIEKKCGVAVR